MKPTLNTLCLDHIHVDNDIILTEKGTAFDAVSYSKFKYGNGAISKNYGEQLARVFIQQYSSILDQDNSFVVSSASYRHIPKGATSITHFFLRYLNDYLESKNKKCAESVKVSSTEPFVGDYASFSAEKRAQLMKKERLTLANGDVKGKKLILIDDIRITGSAEKGLINFFQEQGVTDIFLVYVAIADPVYATSNPQIESVINHVWMDNLEKLKVIMNSKDFMLNARVCKYILSYPKLDELDIFLKELDPEVLKYFYENVMKDKEKYEIDTYVPVLSLIRKNLD